MDGSLSLQGRSSSVASKLRLIAVAALAAGLTACGGGGGGDDGGGGNPPPPPDTGTVTATVLEDIFGTPISGATVTVTSGTTGLDGTTGADGTTTVADVPAGSVSATASAPGFVTSAAQGKTLAADGTTDFDFRLVRATAEAAGGVLTVLPSGSLDPNGRTFTFTMRVVVVDESFDPILGLGDANFSLADCTPVTVGSSLPECVRGTQLAQDRAYTVNATPPGVVAQPAGPARPYAATILLDQSGSIRGTDPTDARLFSTKVFLQGLGASDRALLAAFAEGTEGNTNAQIPEEPVTFYPCATAPCPSPPSFTGTGSSLFDSVDGLAATEGGGTPMYDALVISINATRDNAPTGITDQRLAVVMFSDGMDTTCGFAACVPIRQGVIDLAQPSDPNIRDVDLFTVGLSSDVDSVSLAELAIKGNGTYLFAENANQLIPIYGSLGALLSDSLPTYEMTWTVEAQEDGVFVNGRSLIGRLTVDTGTAEPFELRFIAPIFEL